jgi:hypothetical protein
MEAHIMRTTGTLLVKCSCEYDTMNGSAFEITRKHCDCTVL